MITRIQAMMVALIITVMTATAADQVKFALVRSVTEIDADADGTAQPFITTSYSYQGGVLTGTTLEVDLSGDGVADERSISTLTYDIHGQRMQDVNESYDIATGGLNGRGIITYTYDGSGYQTSRGIETDCNADGTLDYLSFAEFSYDARQNLAGWTNEIDSDANGSWDSMEIVTRVYDADNNLISSTREVTDTAEGQIRNRETWRYTVDSRGNRTFAEHEIDHYADGLVDYSDRTVYGYDRHGRLRASNTEYRASFEEGVVERGLSQSTHFYDRHGNQIKVVQENDGEADGIIDEIRTTTRTYERTRRLE